MSIQETIAADEAAVTAAQEALRVANEKLAADQAKLQAAGSISAMLDQVALGAETFEQETKDAVRALVEQIKGLF